MAFALGAVYRTRAEIDQLAEARRVLQTTGMAFYERALFPAWRASLFVGSLGGRRVVMRLTLMGSSVSSQRGSCE
jgi:glucose/arabinose dehydrogenase